MVIIINDIEQLTVTSSSINIFNPVVVPVTGIFGGIRVGNSLTINDTFKCEICGMLCYHVCSNGHTIHTTCNKTETGCIICKMEQYSNKDVDQFLLKSFGFKNKEDVFRYLQNRFENNYEEFKDFLKEE